MNRIFDKKNLPLFGIFITITIVIAVVIYIKRSDCNLKKMVFRESITLLTAELATLEAELEKHLQDNNLEMVDVLRNDIASISEEINYKQNRFNNIC